MKEYIYQHIKKSFTIFNIRRIVKFINKHNLWSKFSKKPMRINYTAIISTLILLLLLFDIFFNN